MSDAVAPPGTRRLRRLSEEEIELWLTVASSVVARPGSALPARTPKSRPAAEPPRAVAAATLPPPPLPKPAVLPPLAPLERKLKQKLSRGQTTADAAIDLHGLRQDEAQSALQHFLRDAQHHGLKVVLVVTGKGGRTPLAFDMSEQGVGVLRRMVPLWLSLPLFRPLVLGYEEAARGHGGSGALYVRLRRRGT